MVLECSYGADILQLIREAKCLHRLGVDVPETAKMVMLQEVKFKTYFDELSYILKEYERVTEMILPVTEKLFEHLVRDVELKLVSHFLFQTEAVRYMITAQCRDTVT